MAKVVKTEVLELRHGAEARKFSLRNSVLVPFSDVLGIAVAWEQLTVLAPDLPQLQRSEGVVAQVHRPGPVALRDLGHQVDAPLAHVDDLVREPDDFSAAHAGSERESCHTTEKVSAARLVGLERGQG